MSFNHGYALLIGVGACEYPKWSLPTTVKDAQAIQKVLADADLCAYDPEQIRLLHDESATRQGILDGLAWLAQSVQKDAEATAVVYFSGHGWLHKETGNYYLVTHDVEPFNFIGSALSADAFTTALHAIPARRLLVFIDSCHAEGMASAKDVDPLELPAHFSKSAAPESVIAQLKQGEGRAVFTSSRGSQKSWVRQDNQLSLYTHHLLEALDGAGSTPGTTATMGAITVHVSHLMTHLARTVPPSAQQQHQAEQTPFFDLASEDFPVALLRGGKGLPAAGWQEPSQAAQAAGVSYQVTVSDRGTAVVGPGNVTATGGGIAIGGNVGRDVTLGRPGKQQG
ncbi:MAG: caspase family protein [Anaerolineales bacterium]|nr:caspase family protein [Anaerolineales bacterium]